MASADGTPVPGPFGLPGHPLRPRVLGEIHSRPFQLVTAPRTLLQLAFLVEDGDFASQMASLAQVMEARGAARPNGDTRHVAIAWGAGQLRWERHTEFTTWTFDAPFPGNLHEPLRGHPFGDGFRAPGALMSAVRLDLIADADPEPVLAFFDPTSLSASEMDGGRALAASDFRQDADGLTRIVVLDRGLGPARAGALTQRLIEIETYRTLSLLGLPEAQRLTPDLARIERELARIAATLHGATESAALLAELITLSAELEADAAASLHRFSASRAYDEIVEQRIVVVGEKAIPGYETWAGFLARRMAPAMRTCRSVVDRQEALSMKLARAADLLRTRVDVELEHQNRDLLQSMNRRAQSQLRMQQTVEGLSVAAVSYYVIGLIAYLAKGAEEADRRLNPVIVTAVSVPFVVLAIWLLVRRIRRRHDEG